MKRQKRRTVIFGVFLGLGRVKTRKMGVKTRKMGVKTRKMGVKTRKMGVKTRMFALSATLIYLLY